jgi:hypothetical protein
VEKEFEELLKRKTRRRGTISTRLTEETVEMMQAAKEMSSTSIGSEDSFSQK